MKNVATAPTVSLGGLPIGAELAERYEVRGWLEGEGWVVDGIARSPITGPEGNVEFLIAATRSGC